jgi:hypothetical protein
MAGIQLMNHAVHVLAQSGPSAGFHAFRREVLLGPEGVNLIDLIVSVHAFALFPDCVSCKNYSKKSLGKSPAEKKFSKENQALEKTEISCWPVRGKVHGTKSPRNRKPIRITPHDEIGF